MKYINEKCSACGEVFNENSDVVVCPVCATPQHRECYNKNGECVNSHLHETGFEWKPSAEKTGEKSDKKICRFCSAENDGKNLNCSSCGKSFSETKEPEMKRISEMPVDEDGVPYLEDIIEQRINILAPGITPQQRQEKLCGQEIGLTVAFIGNNAKAYVDKFRAIEKNRKRSFNWAAFFFGPFWLFYRRLYKMGIFFLSIYITGAMLAAHSSNVILSKWSYILEDPNLMTEALLSEYVKDALPLFVIMFVLLVINFVIGFVGTWRYWEKCNEDLEALAYERSKGNNADSLRFFLKKSSTSYVSAFLAFLTYEFLPAFLVNAFTQIFN